MPTIFKRILPLLSIVLFVTAAHADDLYVGDFSGGNGSVNYFDAATGTFILKATAPGNTMSFPGQMAIGPNGNLYVADAAGVIDVFNPTSGAFLNQFGSGTLSAPSGLAFSSAGNLYVSDSSGGNGFVDEFDAAGDFLGQTIAPGSALSYPNALTFGPDGNLYIADQNSGDIYQYNLTTFVLSVFATDSSANVNLLFGADGDLYVMSTLNSGTVEVFNGTTGAFIQVFGDTETALGGNGLGMEFGSDGNLYVADTNGVDIVNGTTGNVTGNFISVDGVNVVNPTFLLFQTSSTTPEASTFLFAALGLIAISSLRSRRQ
jgi:sugar lactone lactonase YvrE